jgi:hypothetical protein
MTENSPIIFDAELFEFSARQTCILQSPEGRRKRTLQQRCTINRVLGKAADGVSRSPRGM